MANGDQGRDYAGPWFPPLTAQPVPPPPVSETPVVTRVERMPAWLDDDSEPEPVEAPPRRVRRLWVMPGAATMLVIAGVFGAGVVALASGESGSPGTASLAEPALGSFEDLTPDDWCPKIDTADRIQGADKGDLSTGPGLIMWVMHAWFVERDTAAVRSAFAPGAVVATPEETRTAVESVVSGTKHCVNVVVLADNLFRVRVEQLKPDGSAKSSSDEVVITNVEGRPMISAIRPGD